MRTVTTAASDGGFPYDPFHFAGFRLEDFDVAMSHVLVVFLQSLFQIRVRGELDESFARRTTIARERQVNAVFTAGDPDIATWANQSMNTCFLADDDKEYENDGKTR